MTKFLLVTWEGGGVVPPEIGLGKRLSARGHQVRVLADPSVEAEARAAGCEFSAWTTAPSRASLAPEHEVVKSWGQSPVGQFKAFLAGVMCGPADRYAADTLTTLDAHPADALLIDMNLLGALVAAQARRLPHIALVPNIYMRPTPGIPPLGPGLLPATGPLGRARDALLTWVSRGLWRGGLPAVNATAAAHGVAPYADLFDIFDRADGVFVMTAQAFDFQAKQLPSNVEYIGPVLDDPSWAERPRPDNEGSEPLVVASLSSTYQDQARALQNVADALSALPLRGLITLGPALPPDAVQPRASNVECVRSVAHAQVLPRARAVITHCGHGTTIKALAHGVPLVCMPMGRDQNDNAARVVARGAGIRLKPTASPAKIRAAVRQVLDDDGFRQAAVELGNKIKSAAEFDAAAAVERVLC